MKTLKNISIVLVFLSLMSCQTTRQFPVSPHTPAAEIGIQVTKQKGINHLISIKINYLASPERLTPPRKVYVIWVVSENGVARNVGYFSNMNAKRSVYKFTVPYTPVEVFITAESEEGVTAPRGVEITRFNIINNQ